jgi:hypothetical protein
MEIPMIIKAGWSAIALSVVLWSDAPGIKPGQGSRQKAELSIRKAVYEYVLARSTGDIKTFKIYASQRTLKFYDLLFEVLPDIPGTKEHFAKAGITSGESYLKDAFASKVKILEMYPKPRAELEERAKSSSQGAVAFLNDHEATIVVTEIVTVQSAVGITKKPGKENKWRVSFEGNQWKIDDIEVQKASYLLPPFISLLSPESLAKIRNF